ncbi:MAG: trypsin-like peptidase domain-containing protein [Deinococcus sp.]|uniref:S1C family serine protease n=1 Tax=Deinococcus sp. TaxID=47478 RepID=UPI0026DC9B9D|nr:trypsin-like peptidase domain-containing protein [Deinococcus sp.]MDO4246206.1 trypsin-like peptidase domain-containing protein [Deinococcus sp.]
MKSKGIAVLLVLAGLGLGATLLRDQVPLGEARPASVTPPSASAKLENERNTIEIVQKHEPGLVFISTEERVVQQDPFGWFLGGPQTEVQRGVGSGFFVNDAGDILTNYHVVAGSSGRAADRIQVRLYGGSKTVDAEVVGLAPMYDLALIRAKGLSKADIHAIPLGDSDKISVGQKAVAMGAPFGLEFSVSEGIVSASARQIPIGFSQSGEGITQRAIQTDAAINPGNSGGPLLDSAGQVIGINTQIYSPSGQAGAAQSAGVGFAIPINAAKNLLPRLQAAQGKVVNAPRIGVVPGIIVLGRNQAMAVGLGMLDPRGKAAEGLPDTGLLIGEVAPNSPAARAGLQGGTRTEEFRDGKITLGGDVIVEAAGQPIDALEDLQAVILDRKVGDQIELKVVRQKQERRVTLTLDESAFQ